MRRVDLNEHPSKVYIEIVKKLRLMIQKNHLKAGDKIPSERELSERLNVGRSSVREALCSLELLGLIETRRGEGTFIRDSRDNQLVYILSTFVLQDEKARQDVKETKSLIEMDCLRLAMERNNGDKLSHMEEWLHKECFNDDDFFEKVVGLADNHLLFRIWTLLKDYYRSFQPAQLVRNKNPYIKLLRALMQKDEQSLWNQYKKIRTPAE